MTLIEQTREVLSIRQAAAYLGISPDTLYKYVQTDFIPAFKLGNRWRLKRSLLDQWMEQQSMPVFINTCGSANA